MSGRARLAGSVVFGATMGFFEAAVVVYLRRLWEIGEIDVASASISNRLILTEVLREAASLVMIGSVAWLAGRRGVERLAHAAVIFGIWDLLYYAYLRLLIGWPAAVLDWDVLFLIPRPWVGPVLAPVLVSVALVAGGTTIVLREEGARPVYPGRRAWALGIAGGCVVVASFLVPTVPRSVTDVPSGFSWTLFALGLATALAGLLDTLRRETEPLGGRPRPPGQHGLHRRPGTSGLAGPPD